MTAEKRIEVKSLYKRYSLQAGFFARAKTWVHAVNGLSFFIRPNEIYGLVGESGCGKTSTARLLVKMFSIDQGEIIFTDESGQQYSVHSARRQQLKTVRSKIRYIFQDPARSLNPRLRIQEILLCGYRYSPQWPGKSQAFEEAAAVMRSVGLSPDDLQRRPADFSGGQRQRISIARALMARPQLLICDEVVSALDVSIQGQILDLLLKIRERYALSILFIAHDLSVVSYVSDRVGVMYRGMIMEEARSQEIISDARHPYTRHLYACVPQLHRKVFDSTGLTRYGEIPDLTEPPAWNALDMPGQGNYWQVSDEHRVFRFT